MRDLTLPGRAAPSQRKLLQRLVLGVAGMFAFAFALVPLYDVLCQVTGLGGRTRDTGYVFDPATRPDLSRELQVNFLTNTNAGMPWQFEPVQRSVRVHPGMLTEVLFRVYNPTSRAMVGQAIPSLVPISALDHFHKTECFCFGSQRLEPGESLTMPMRFVVDAGVPKGIESISLSYTLYDITARVEAPAGET
jgi:cytochrome c oxidase assembly protein subunit 11